MGSQSRTQLSKWNELNVHFQKTTSYQRINTAQVDSWPPSLSPANALTRSGVLVSQGEGPLRQTDVCAAGSGDPGSRSSHCPLTPQRWWEAERRAAWCLEPSEGWAPQDHSQSAVSTFRNTMGIKGHCTDSQSRNTRTAKCPLDSLPHQGRLFRHSTPNKEKELEEEGLGSFA